jgi:NADPH2:quinone reductase
MRAAYYETNGPANEVLVIGTVEEPVAGPGEVRIKLTTSGVNPSDVKARAGLTRKIAFPRVIPHSDGVGVIDQVGAGVPHSRLGERVWTWNAQWRRPFGTCAQYVALPADMAVPLPAGTDDEAGACLGIPAMTGWHAVAVAGIDAASTILVSGGAGSVSQYAIQFAKARGAVVIATVSSPGKARLARAAGADHTIDYKRDDVAAAVKELTGGAGVGAVLELDIAANAPLLPGVIEAGGKVVIYGTGATEAAVPLYFFLANRIKLEFIFVYDLTLTERAAAVAGINDALAAGWLKHAIAACYPLDEVVAAHMTVEAGTAVGNVVIRLP